MRVLPSYSWPLALSLCGLCTSHSVAPSSYRPIALSPVSSLSPYRPSPPTGRPPGRAHRGPAPRSPPTYPPTSSRPTNLQAPAAARVGRPAAVGVEAAAGVIQAEQCRCPAHARGQSSSDEKGQGAVSLLTTRASRRFRCETATRTTASDDKGGRRRVAMNRIVHVQRVGSGRPGGRVSVCAAARLRRRRRAARPAQVLVTDGDRQVAPVEHAAARADRRHGARWRRRAAAGRARSTGIPRARTG